jgi:hypothetical protein
MPYRAPDQRAVTPQNRGRFPGFDVLNEVDTWDDVTAGVVLARLALPGEYSFFTPEEVGIATALTDLLLHQDGEPKVPIVPLIDQRLSVGETDGWHYDDLPEDAEAWRTSLHHLDDDARARFGREFVRLVRSEQAAILQDVQDLSSKNDPWHGWPSKHVWSLWTRYSCAAFYSHPWAWNEIGYPGPAYPRGYLNPGVNARDKWEVADHRDADPVPFAERTERARKRHAELVEKEGRS